VLNHVFCKKKYNFVALTAVRLNSAEFKSGARSRTWGPSTHLLKGMDVDEFECGGLHQSVPHREQYTPIPKTKRLMLFREIIVVYCENHTEFISTFCG
jgi:hypothetical protein